VKELLRHNAVNVNAVSNGGQTPLSYARSRAYNEVVTLLLGHKSINIGEKNSSAHTPDVGTKLLTDRGESEFDKNALLLKQDMTGSQENDAKLLRSGEYDGRKSDNVSNQLPTRHLVHGLVHQQLHRECETVSKHPPQDDRNITSQIDSQQDSFPVDLDSIISRHFEAMNCDSMGEVQLSEEEVRFLCTRSREVLMSQPSLLELEAPIKVCG
jgi:hypothetical protein